MSSTPQSLFFQIRPVAPANLPDRILAAIEAERIAQVTRHARLAAWSAGTWFFAFLASIAYVGKSFISSEFWQIASLLFTDFSVSLAHSEDFFISLAETFPAASAMLIIAPLFLYAVSLVLRSKYLGLTTDHRQFQFQVVH